MVREKFIKAFSATAEDPLEEDPEATQGFNDLSASPADDDEELTEEQFIALRAQAHDPNEDSTDNVDLAALFSS